MGFMNPLLMLYFRLSSYDILEQALQLHIDDPFGHCYHLVASSLSEELLILVVIHNCHYDHHHRAHYD